MASWRPRYHLAPPIGRLNDPNGLYLSGEELHVYYQHDPVFPRPGKRTGWGHTVLPLEGPDALIPQHLPDALYPSQNYDLDGCYSGCAVLPEGPGGPVELFYTGNLKTNGLRIPSQNRVRVEQPDAPHGGIYHRDPRNPLIDGPPPGITGHLRDPHITRDDQGRWRMLLGAQFAGTPPTGGLVAYTSDDLSHWDYAGPIDFESTEVAGYMWECPNLMTLTDTVTGESTDLLVFCPQGPDRCGFMLGHLRGTTFAVTRDYTELDGGPQFYAPQLISETPETALMLAWMGKPGEDDMPTVAEGWVHMLTLPRRLSLHNGMLHQEVLLPEGDDLGDFFTLSGAFDATTADGEELLVLRDHEGADVVKLTVIGPGLMRLERAHPHSACTISTPHAGRWEAVVDGAAVEIFVHGDAESDTVSLTLQAFPHGGWT